MKKAAIFGITAFYLLLTSGMFACVVHCTTEKLVTKPVLQMACTRMPKHCNGCKDNNCCKKHPNFIIKENLRPRYDVHFPITSVTIPQIQLPGFLLNNTDWHNNILWINGNAPPGSSGKSIVIKSHSLLI